MQKEGEHPSSFRIGIGQSDEYCPLVQCLTPRHLSSASSASVCDTLPASICRMIDRAHSSRSATRRMNFCIRCRISGDADTLTGRVVRVTDGDTIVVLDGTNTQHKIRLQGIDAPERGQAFGTKSKEYLSDLVTGETVAVDYSKSDRYQRIVGKVVLDGQDMNLEQIQAGMAWHYKKYQGEQTVDDRVAYSDSELDARRYRRGLWADSNPMAPWEYRQDKRQQRKDMEAFTRRSKVQGSQ